MCIVCSKTGRSSSDHDVNAPRLLLIKKLSGVVATSNTILDSRKEAVPVQPRVCGRRAAAQYFDQHLDMHFSLFSFPDFGFSPLARARLSKSGPCATLTSHAAGGLAEVGFPHVAAGLSVWVRANPARFWNRTSYLSGECRALNLKSTAYQVHQVVASRLAHLAIEPASRGVFNVQFTAL